MCFKICVAATCESLKALSIQNVTIVSAEPGARLACSWHPGVGVRQHKAAPHVAPHPRPHAAVVAVARRPHNRFPRTAA